MRFFRNKPRFAPIPWEMDKASTRLSNQHLLWAIGVFTVLALGLHWGISWLIPPALRPTTVFSVGTVTPALAAALVYALLERKTLFSPEVRRRIWGARPLVILGGIALVLGLQALVFTIIIGVTGSFSLTTVQQQLAHSHFRGLPLPAAAALAVVVNLLIGTLLGVFPCLGEEIGWRGFLYPRLQSLVGYAGAVIIGGIIWSFWHSPEFYFLHDFNYYALSWWMGFVYFCLFTVPGGIVLYWLYHRSGSILAPALAHAAVDVSFNLMGMFLNPAKLTARITTPGGALTMIVWWLAALVILWSDHRRGLLPVFRRQAVGSGATSG